MESIKEGLKVIGEFLQKEVEESAISITEICQKTNLNPKIVSDVLEGEPDILAIDLLKIIYGLDLYVFFAPKAGKKDQPLDVDDMIRKLHEFDPYQ